MVYAMFAIGGITQLGMRSYVKAITGHYPYWSTRLWLGLQIYQTLSSISAFAVLAGLYLAPPAVLSRLVSVFVDHTPPVPALTG